MSDTAALSAARTTVTAGRLTLAVRAAAYTFLPSAPGSSRTATGPASAPQSTGRAAARWAARPVRRLRVATGLLYGRTDAEREAALASPEPLALPWIASALTRLEDALDDLTSPTPHPPR
jgi:hypothetical protein